MSIFAAGNRNINMEKLVEQLGLLFNAMAGDTGVDTEPPLVRIGLAVINNCAEIIADQMSLSSFNVLLSENHGKCFVPVVKFPTLNKNVDFMNSITSAIEDFIISESKIDKNLAQALKYVVDENIDNIIEHADTPDGFICASWDESGVTVCIADAGKTIYGSYIDGEFDEIYSDQIALKAALSGVSTKNLPGAENRGYGISTSADMIVKGMDSTLIMLSGRGLLFYRNERIDYTELPESIFMPGTLVCFSMPIHKPLFSLYNHIGG